MTLIAWNYRKLSMYLACYIIVTVTILLVVVHPFQIKLPSFSSFPISPTTTNVHNHISPFRKRNVLFSHVTNDSKGSRVGNNDDDDDDEKQQRQEQRNQFDLSNSKSVEEGLNDSYHDLVQFDQSNNNNNGDGGNNGIRMNSSSSSNSNSSSRTQSKSVTVSNYLVDAKRIIQETKNDNNQNGNTNTNTNTNGQYNHDGKNHLSNIISDSSSSTTSQKEQQIMNKGESYSYLNFFSHDPSNNNDNHNNNNISNNINNSQKSSSVSYDANTGYVEVKTLSDQNQNHNSPSSNGSSGSGGGFTSNGYLDQIGKRNGEKEEEKNNSIRPSDTSSSTTDTSSTQFTSNGQRLIEEETRVKQEQKIVDGEEERKIEQKRIEMEQHKKEKIE